jgi:hypothetical protein
MVHELWHIKYDVLVDKVGTVGRNGFIFYDITYASFDEAKDLWSNVTNHVMKNLTLAPWCEVVITGTNLLMREPVMQVPTPEEQQQQPEGPPPEFLQALQSGNLQVDTPSLASEDTAPTESTE